MTEEIKTNENKTVPVGNVSVAEDQPKNTNTRGGKNVRGKGGKPGARRGGGRKPFVREKPEFDSKTISIRRVTRVVAGGRRFSLAVSIVLGDRNGRIGLGTGKSIDTQMAIEKATKDAKKHMIHLKLNKDKSLPFDISAKYKTAQVKIMPNKAKGLIAGSSARIILSLAGVQNVTAKFHSGTKNKLNNARVTMKALEQIAYSHRDAPVPAVKVAKEEVIDKK